MSKSLFKSTSLVSAMTFISRILGFIRDMIAARIFGVNPSVDAFYIAFKIPNFMRSLFAEGSFSQAFVPVLSEYRQTKSPAEVKQFISHMLANLGLVLMCVTVIGELFTPLIVIVTAPGLDPQRFHMATDMLRVTFPYLMFISLTAFCGSILNSYGSFGIPSLTPALLNIALITAALWFSPFFHIPVESQAWGVFAAGIIQLLFQLPFLKRQGFLVWPRLNWHDPGVRKVLYLMIPALFGASVTQISLLLNTIFASFLKVGSVSWLYYSDRLAYFPLGVFGVAVATVVLPHLSRKHAEKNPQQFTQALDWGLRLNLLIGIPASLILWVFAAPMITTLFAYGKFTTYDVLMTRQSVIAYAVGLQAFMLVKLLVTGFYSRQDIKTPVRYSVIALIVSMSLNAALIIPLAHAGLALATSLSSWTNVLLLYWGLKKREIFQVKKGWYKFLLQLSFANVLMVAFLWWQQGSLQTWLSWSGYQRFYHLFALLLFAGVIYLVGLIISGIKIKELLSMKEVV